MSSPIQILNVSIDKESNNENSLITDPIKIHVQLEVTQQLQSKLDWTLIYIGSSNDMKHDQILEDFSVMPEDLGIGIAQFAIEANGPDVSKIPSKDDLFGVTAMILSVKYFDQQFMRVGFYVYNHYSDPLLIEQEPENPIISKISRKILEEKVRVIKYDIKWDGPLTSVEQLQVLNDLTNQNQAYAQMMPNLFEKSNGIFEKLQQIPNYGHYAPLIPNNNVQNENQGYNNNNFCNQNNDYNNNIYNNGCGSSNFQGVNNIFANNNNMQQQQQQYQNFQPNNMFY